MVAELEGVLDNSDVRRENVSKSIRDRFADGRLRVMLELELGLTCCCSSRNVWNGKLAHGGCA